MPTCKTKKVLGLPFTLALLAGTLLAAPAIAQTSITLPLFGDGETGVDAVIDWGDAAANETCQRAVTFGPNGGGEVTCNYPAEAGAPPYTVRVSGTVPRFGNGDAGYANADRIRRVTRFGNVGLTSLSGAFRGAERLEQVAPDFPETVTDISHIFKDAVLLDDDTVSNWGMRVRNVVNMDGAFENAVQFDQPLDRWCMRNRTTPPAAFRALNRTQQQLTEIEQRLQNRGISVNLSNSMRFQPQNEPRWGQCGVDLPTTPPPQGQAGEAYTLDLAAGVQLWDNAGEVGADPNALRFEIVQGNLPDGLTLNEETGLITGTPSESGTFTFKIKAFQPES